MLKLIKCEFLKLRRRRLLQAAFCTSIIMPIFYSLLLASKDLDDIMSVVREENGFLLLMPLLVVIAANLFFEEHDCDTLKNLLCVPVAKHRISLAKIFVLLVFAMGYEMAGFVVGMATAILSGVALHGWGLQLFLTLGTGILLWAAALPCIFLVVWFNRSYIISIIVAFAYTVLNYILHLYDVFVMVPLGLNVATFLPVPMIFRWLYQFHSLEGAGEMLIAFYNRFSPYFVSTSIIFAVMMVEAIIGIALTMKVYQKQEI